MSGQHRIVPPIYLLAALLAAAGLHYGLPLARIIPDPVRYLGAVLVVAGLALILWAAGLFHRARTPIRPFTHSTTVVTGGPYRFTRNPMYLGMATILLGEALCLGSLTAFVPLPLFVWQIQRKFIVPEEAFLAGLFGERYTGYKAGVRRWL